MSSDFDINLLAISSPSFQITPRPRYPEIAVERTRRLFSIFLLRIRTLLVAGNVGVAASALLQAISDEPQAGRLAVGGAIMYKRRPHRGGCRKIGVTLQIVHDWVAKVNARGLHRRADSIALLPKPPISDLGPLNASASNTQDGSGTRE